MLTICGVMGFPTLISELDELFKRATVENPLMSADFLSGPNNESEVAQSYREKLIEVLRRECLKLMSKCQNKKRS
jgi:hypothetical protein